MHIENGHTGGNTEMRSKKWTGTKFGNFSCKTMEGWYQNNQFRKQRTDHGDCEPNGSVQYERAKYKTYRNRRPISLDDCLCDRELEQIARAKANRTYVEPRYCDCPETLVNGQRVPCPPCHNCEYARARSELVPIATERANEAAGNINGKGSWVFYFAMEMERLAGPLLNGYGNSGRATRQAEH